MMLKVGDKPYVLKSAADLVKHEICSLAFEKGLVAKIFQGDEHIGYYFRGRGSLIIDTVVETVNGAVGEPTSDVFSRALFISPNPPELGLEEAGEEALNEYGYRGAQDFLEEASRVLERLVKPGYRQPFLPRNLEIFVLRSGSVKHTLVIKGRRLIYASGRRVFIYGGKKRRPGLLIGIGGKTIAMGSDAMLVEGFPIPLPFKL